MFQITVSKVFAAAHAIRLPDGQLEPVHGHNWQVKVKVEASELDEIETVMDFHVLEQALDALLATVHNRHLNEAAPFTDGHGGLRINPTAERVAWWLGEALLGQVPGHARLVSVEVSEAPGCTAIYLP